MDLQDILILVGGPQGWLLIASGILLLLVWLVYRRLGKLAVTTRKDVAELREAIAQCADRLDKVSQASLVVSGVTGGTEAGLSMTQSSAAEMPDSSEDDGLYEAPTISGNAISLDEDESATRAYGDLPEDPQEAGEVLDEPFDDICACDTPTMAEDDAALMEADIDPPEELQDAGERLDEPAGFTFVFESTTAVVDETAPNKAAAEAGGGGDLPEELQAADETLDEPSGYVFGLKNEEPAENEAEWSRIATTQVTTAEAWESVGFGDMTPVSAEEEHGSVQVEVPQADVLASQSPIAEPFEAAVEGYQEDASDPVPPAQAASPEPSADHPDRPQVGVTRCGECGRKIAYPQRLSGKRMRCPVCRTTSTLP